MQFLLFKYCMQQFQKADTYCNFHTVHLCACPRAFSVVDQYGWVDFLRLFMETSLFSLSCAEQSKVLGTGHNPCSHYSDIFLSLPVCFLSEILDIFMYFTQTATFTNCVSYRLKTNLVQCMTGKVAYIIIFLNCEYLVQVAQLELLLPCTFWGHQERSGVDFHL